MAEIPHNFIADMYGPEFLFFFIGFIAFTSFSCWLAKRYADPTLMEMPPPVPIQPDPYEIAYLRGGAVEVSKLVVFNLVQRNYLTQTTENNRYYIKRSTEPPDGKHLTPLEYYVYTQFAVPMLPREIFLKNQIPSRIESYCVPYENKLERERLLCTEDIKQRANMIMIAGMTALMALGGYKIYVALLKGRSNVGFLIFLIIIGAVVVYKVCKPDRISGKGRSYLDQLQLAYDKFKTKAATKLIPNDPADSSSPDPVLMMTMVGVFGVGALAGSHYNEYNQMIDRTGITENGSVSWSNSSVTSSCGSSSCSSSSSSCSSGSSCGGGGCGGCGGGGCGG